jgi:hypothetical protein
MYTHFTGEVALGNILTIVTLLGIALRFTRAARPLRVIILGNTKRVNKGAR